MEGFSEKLKCKLSDDVFIEMKTAKQKPKSCAPALLYGTRKRANIVKSQVQLPPLPPLTRGVFVNNRVEQHARAQCSRFTAARAKFKHVYSDTHDGTADRR